MKDRDIDTHLRQHLTGDKPREAFKQQTLRDSTAQFIRVYRRRSAWRRAELAAAAVFIASIAFLGGRLSAPPASTSSADDVQQATAEPEGVTVPNDLVAWLDAARLFNQLGMQDRMARAVEQAGKLLPTDTVTANGQTSQVFAAGGSVDNQNEHMEPIAVHGPQPSADSINQILAQSLGD
jgi:hypothetical protein